MTARRVRWLSTTSYADLERAVALVNDRGTRKRITFPQRVLRAHCVREMARRERITALANAIVDGSHE